jgi:WD40 repeat protein
MVMRSRWVPARTPPHAGGVRSLVMAPDGSRLASASNDRFTGGEVRVWDSNTGAALTSLRVAGNLFHLQATLTTIAAAGERGLYLLRLCRDSQPKQAP